MTRMMVRRWRLMMARMMNLVVDGSFNSSTGSSSLCRWWSTAEHKDEDCDGYGNDDDDYNNDNSK